MGQFGFFDANKRLEALSAKGNPLEAIDALVPWESFRETIEAVVLTPEEAKKSKAGRKPIDTIVMFRMLILQSLYNLSDEQIEYQVCDQMSFARFLKLGIVDSQHVAGRVCRQAYCSAETAAELDERGFKSRIHCRESRNPSAVERTTGSQPQKEHGPRPDRARVWCAGEYPWRANHLHHRCGAAESQDRFAEPRPQSSSAVNPGADRRRMRADRAGPGT